MYLLYHIYTVYCTLDFLPSPCYINLNVNYIGGMTMKTMVKLCAIVVLTGAVMTGGWYMCVGLNATFGWWTGTNAMADSYRGPSYAGCPRVECHETNCRNDLQQLDDQLRAAETREADAQAELAEARAEIERLKAEKKHARRIDDVTCLGPVCVF